MSPNVFCQSNNANIFRHLFKIHFDMRIKLKLLVLQFFLTKLFVMLQKLKRLGIAVYIESNLSNYSAVTFLANFSFIFIFLFFLYE